MIKLDKKTLNELLDLHDDTCVDQEVYLAEEVDEVVDMFSAICYSFNAMLNPPQKRIVHKDIKKLNALKKAKIYTKEDKCKDSKI